jgi:hypothetical protein
MALPKAEQKKYLDELAAKGGFKIWPPPGGHLTDCVYMDNGYKDFSVNCVCPGGLEYGPTPKQEQGFTIPHQHELDILLIYGGGRGMKCLAKGTEVVMFDGTLRKVEDVRVGDLLIGPDSFPRTVTCVGSGRETMYKVIPNKGEPFICNESHILSLKNSGSKDRYGDILNVSVKEYLNWSKRKQTAFCLYRSPAVSFEESEKSLLIDSYILGLWLGDGTKHSFDVTTMDPEIEEAIYSYAEVNNWRVRISIKKGQDNKAKTYCLGGVLRETSPLFQLRHHNLQDNKHIPQEYKQSSIESRLQLLAGLIDTDGTLHPHKYYIITQKNKSLLEDVAFVARSLGLGANIVPFQGGCYYKGEWKGGTYYRMNLYGDIDKIPVRIQRKKCLDKHSRSSVLVTNFILEKLEEDTYYGFTIDGPDKLFLLKDFTVTHNSSTGCAIGFDVLLSTPGVDTMIGCHEYKHLERTVLNDYKKRLTIHNDWDSPLLRDMGGRPTTHDHTIKIKNNATCYCMHFSDFTILRGANLAFAHLEEASLIKDKSVLGEIIRRMSSTLVKQKRIVITTNPEESKGWIYETFALKQFEPGYNGPPIQIGKLCNCEYCQDCLNDENYLGDESEEILYKDGICNRCFGTDPKKKNRGKKFTTCPGAQQFWRVIMVDPKDNPHLSQSYRQTQKLTTSDAEFNLYTRGDVVELRKGFVYSAFKYDNNVLKEDKPFDYSKDMFWSHDFNISFRASVINQEWQDDLGAVHSDVIDEIVLPEADPEDVAIELLTRYHAFDNTIYLTFDPAAFNRKYRKDDGGVEVRCMLDVLEHPEKYRFAPDDVLKLKPRYPECKPKRVIQLTIKEENATKVFVSARVKSTNKMLDDEAGSYRLMINPRCKFTIMSLDSMKWLENNGKPVMDVSVDKAASKRPDKSGVYVLSHPTDALGYYIYKRFPAVANKYSEMYVLLPGEGGLYTDESGATRKADKRELPKIVHDPDEAVDTTPLLLRVLRESQQQEDSGYSINQFFGF